MKFTMPHSSSTMLHARSGLLARTCAFATYTICAVWVPDAGAAHQRRRGIWYIFSRRAYCRGSASSARAASALLADPGAVSRALEYYATHLCRAVPSLRPVVFRHGYGPRLLSWRSGGPAARLHVSYLSLQAMQRLKAELAQLEKDNTDLTAQVAAAQAPTADTLASYSCLCRCGDMRDCFYSGTILSRERRLMRPQRTRPRLAACPSARAT